MKTTKPPTRAQTSEPTMDVALSYEKAKMADHVVSIRRADGLPSVAEVVDLITKNRKRGVS
jgi:hypothetical protein